MEWPVDIVPSTNDFSLNYKSRGFTSPFTGVRQGVSLPGASWEITLTFTNIQSLERRRIETLTDQLKGDVEPIKMRDHLSLGAPPQGAPVVAEAAKGRSLQTSGWMPSVKVLSMGDLFTVAGELKRAQEDVFSDSSGLATIQFNPPMRKSAPLNSVIETKDPWMWATLKEKGVKFSRRQGGFSDVTLTFAEAIYR